MVLSLAPTWRRFKEETVAPTWTCPARGASRAPTTALALHGGLRQSLPSEKVPAAPEQSFPQGIKECSFSSWHLCPRAPSGGGKGGEESGKQSFPPAVSSLRPQRGLCRVCWGWGRYASAGSLPGRHAHSRQWEKATGVREDGGGVREGSGRCLREPGWGRAGFGGTEGLEQGSSRQVCEHGEEGTPGTFWG